MHKKILAICAALVAFAVAPAMASASPVLQEGGATVATGSTITATNDGNIVFTSNLGPVTCTESDLHGKVVTNSGKLIEGTIEAALFKGCHSWAGSVTVTPENLHWCIKSGAFGSFTLRGGGCNEAQRALMFTLDFSFGQCTFERTSAVNGTYNSGTTPVTLLLTGEPEFVRVSGGFGCPSFGKLHAAYWLETTNGTGLTIN
jgi:hypothetical protein